MGRPHRNRYLRAFEAWLKQHRASLGVTLQRLSCRKHGIEYSVGRYADRVRLYVRRGDISVAALREDRVWDLLYSQESLTRRVAGGVICALCEAPVERFPHPQALWLKHDFEPLGQWLKETFENQPDIVFHAGQGWTWAYCKAAQTQASEDAPSEPLASQLECLEYGHGCRTE